MTINDLIKTLNPSKVVLWGTIGNFEIKGISFDSRDKVKSTVFFAYKGESYDSHKDIDAILASHRADFIVSEKYLGEHVPHAVVKDGRVALAEASSAYFDNPTQWYKLVAVTGTNGKTTTTYLLDAIFKELGCKTVRIGTTGIDVNGKNYTTDNTTPSSFDVYKYLREGVGESCNFASMEVSSHALAQRRLGGFKFDAAIFTNLTGDHLDFHKDMEKYFDAKVMLFTDEMSKFKIVNTEYDYGKQLAGRIKNNLVTFSAKGNADIYPVSYRGSLEGSPCELSVFGKCVEIYSPLIGKYNLENIMGAIGAAYVLNKGVDLDLLASGVNNLANVPGRLEKYTKNGITAFVDYAHTDDALRSVLENLKSLAEGRMITLFGAGGERDKTKRPRMGRIATKFSDVVIITSDNPRTEDQMDIINDILAGIDKNTKAKVIVEPDREKAIEIAVNEARDLDIVLLAGKGHENYQVIGTENRPFQDSVILKRFLEKLS